MEEPRSVDRWDSMILNDMLAVQCPHCNHQFTKSVSSLQAVPRFACPQCAVEVHAFGFLRQVKRFVAELNGPGRTKRLLRGRQVGRA